MKGVRVPLPDGRRLHLVCAGRGAPEVLFESGYGATAAAWDKVAPVLARQTRVCAYDRAGYGESDPGPVPRDGAAVVADLDAMLREAGERGPFVMVGHSAGGLYVRLFADRRADDVVGMVLVDPSLDHQDRQMAFFGRRGADLSGIRAGVQHCLEVARGWSDDPAKRCGDKGKLVPASLEDQISELDMLWGRTSDEVGAGRASYGDMPLIVLTAGAGYDNLPPDAKALVLGRWRAAHQAIAARSRRGQERLVDSGHLIMVTKPEAVVQAVQQVLGEARGRPKP